MIPFLSLIVSNLFVASLIALLAWQVGRSGRRAMLAHVLWVVFFIKLITPPIVVLPIEVPQAWIPQNLMQVSVLSDAGRKSLAVIENAEGASEPDAAQSIVSAEALPEPTVAVKPTLAVTLGTCVGLVWLLGFLIVVVRGLIRFIRFHRLLHREGKLDEEATGFVQQLLSRESKYPVRGPDVLRLPVRVSPMLFGFGRAAVIVCPDQLWQSLSQDDRQAFLAHETAHYYRRDHWIRWLEWIVTATYWWFPAVYFARHQLERHEEACCDAWAVSRLQTPPRSYAEALLRVVDFISDHDIGIPRLASGMQPTDTLEERLRLVMKPQLSYGPSSVGWMSCVACFVMWIVHPIPMPESLVVETTDIEIESLVFDSPPAIPETPPQKVEVDLPDAPYGFWNKSPRRRWADFSLSLPGAHLVADADRGISIEVEGRDSLQFSINELSVIAEVPATNRVIIGDRKGQVRLWDLNAGMPVSLIGRHAAQVTSLAYHTMGGLVSADEGGSVIRWDLQSGQVLATWSTKNENTLFSSAFKPASIQSVRFSSDGSMVAILTGGWSDLNSHRVYFLQGQTLEPISSLAVDSNTAVVVQSPEHGWVAVDWLGNVRSIGAESSVGKLEKHEVSALVFSSLAGQFTINESLN
ncbi:MAG: M56 family metallopeptidase [Rubripirellula sp.]